MGERPLRRDAARDPGRAADLTPWRDSRPRRSWGEHTDFGDYPPGVRNQRSVVKLMWRRSPGRVGEPGFGL